MTPITYRNQTIERLEAENKALREALEEISTRALDVKPKSEWYTRPVDYAQAYGAWTQAELARRALKQAAQAKALEPGEGD